MEDGRLRLITGPEASAGGRRAGEAGSRPAEEACGDDAPPARAPACVGCGRELPPEDSAISSLRESAGEGAVGDKAASAAPAGEVKRPADRANSPVPRQRPMQEKYNFGLGVP